MMCWIQTNVGSVFKVLVVLRPQVGSSLIASGVSFVYSDR